MNLPLLSQSLLVAAFSCWLALASAAEPARTVVRPEDNGQPLVNPGMGWTLHFYSNSLSSYGSRLEPSDTLDDWPGLSVIYLRLPWSFLEPKEGQFNWSLFDTPAQRWIAKGKRIAIRVSCSEGSMRYATPKWVQEAGAKGVDFEFGKGPRAGGPLWDPDYLDPVFLAKLDHFLAAMARRYDGNPNVAFIDVGSFGMWGEGHTGFSSRLNDEQTLKVVKRHMDLHVKNFKQTQLCISDDVAGPSTPGRHFPAMDYAISKGISMRDDSILVQPPPNSWYHAEMAQEFWPRMPVIIEHEHYGGSKARNAWGDGSLLLKSVEDYHASYMSIHWWPREELAENRDVVAHINRRLGYRLQLRELSWPSQVALSEPFMVEAAWANAGVAPCYGGGFCGAHVEGPARRHRVGPRGRAVRSAAAQARRSRPGRGREILPPGSSSAWPTTIRWAPLRRRPGREATTCSSRSANATARRSSRCPCRAMTGTAATRWAESASPRARSTLGCMKRAKSSRPR